MPANQTYNTQGYNIYRHVYSLSKLCEIVMIRQGIYGISGRGGGGIGDIGLVIWQCIGLLKMITWRVGHQRPLHVRPLHIWPLHV